MTVIVISTLANALLTQPTIAFDSQRTSYECAGLGVVVPLVAHEATSVSVHRSRRVRLAFVLVTEIISFTVIHTEAIASLELVREALEELVTLLGTVLV